VFWLSIDANQPLQTQCPKIAIILLHFWIGVLIRTAGLFCLCSQGQISARKKFLKDQGWKHLEGPSVIWLMPGLSWGFWPKSFHMVSHCGLGFLTATVATEWSYSFYGSGLQCFSKWGRSHMAFLDLSLEVKKTVPCLPYFLSQKDSKSTQSQVESAQTKLLLVLCSFQYP
jgi:hypothetical protein